jgi:hypothetical protein
MEIDAREGHQGRVEHDGDPPVRVVEKRERCHRARLDAERLAQQLGRAERQTPRRADRLVQPLQVDGGLVARDDEEQAALLVLEEQVLGMPARERCLDRPRLRHGEDRRVLRRLGGDAELFEEGEEIGRGGGGHGGALSGAASSGRRAPAQARTPPVGRSGIGDDRAGPGPSRKDRPLNSRGG